MSDSHTEPGDAAPAGLVKHAQVQNDRGTQDAREADPTISKPWPAASHSSSSSLLTQALAASRTSDAQESSSIAQCGSKDNLSTPPFDDTQHHDMNIPGHAADTMAQVAPAYSSHADTTPSLGTTPTASGNWNIFDLRGADSLLENHRQLLNKPKGRGTSLERTDKEKRTLDIRRGQPSVTFGDADPKPSTDQVIKDPITDDPPTDGERAKYRSWREPQSNASGGKAWSIDEQGGDDSHGGQVEKSVAEALVSSCSIAFGFE